MTLNQINILSKQIVDDIIDDLSERSGVGNEWDELDEDIQDEIKEKWMDIIKKRIPVRIENKDKSSDQENRPNKV